MQESAEHLKQPLPTTFSQLLAYCHQKVVAGIENEQSLHPYVELSEAKDTPGIIDITRRTYTVLFWYPVNGLYHIAVNCQSFPKFICGWMEAVQDSYLLSAAV